MADGMSLDIQQMMTALDLTDKKMNTGVNKALKLSAEPLKDSITRGTPVSTNARHKYGEGHAKDDVVITNVKGGATDEKHVDVGYKNTNWRMKFVEFGTVYQAPQPNVQKSIRSTKNEVLKIQVSELRKVLGT